MLDFLLAPVLSFFSRRLYGKVLNKGVGFGFLYLFYLTILFCLLAFFLGQFILAPVVKDFTGWFVSSTPELKITASGLEAAAKQPYLVKHPALGPLFMIDTSKDLNALNADESKVPILVGKDHVLVRDFRRKETRVFNLSSLMERAAKDKQPVRITKEVMRELLNRLYGIIAPIVLAVGFLIFFIWKLLAALFYS